MQFSFWKPHFWHPHNFAKTLLWHNVTLFVFLNMPPKHDKNGGKQWNKKLDQFSTQLLEPVFNTKTPKSWTSFWLHSIYIYAVELKTGPRFGVSNVKNWSKPSVKNWSKFFFHCFLLISERFALPQSPTTPPLGWKHEFVWGCAAECQNGHCCHFWLKA